MNPLHRVVTGDLRKHRTHRRSDAVVAVIDELERRLFLSGTFSPVVDFNGVDGEPPVAVVADSAGDLFGVTTYTTNSTGSTVTSGALFEVPAGTKTVTDLATLDFDSEVDSGESLIIDSSGNMFGTEAGSATAGVIPSGGTLFEVAQGTTTPTPLATFPSEDLGIATAVDSSGDVFGIVGPTAGPGSVSTGEAFKVVKGSGTLTMLTTTLNLSALQLGPDGNLYGTTTTPDAVVEISPTTGNVTPLASFVAATSGSSPTGITFDTSGNLWGTCSGGGPNGDGTIWELPTGQSTISLIAPFTSGTPSGPLGRAGFDSSGNLFGVAISNGANGTGGVFELPSGGNTITDLVDFNSNYTVDSAFPAGVVLNSSGQAAGVSAGANNPKVWGAALFGGDGAILQVNSVTTPTSTLTPTVSKDTLTGAVVAGAKLKAAVTVNISNSGTASSGTVTVNLYASTTPTLTGAMLIDTLAVKSLKLKTGKAKAFSLKISALPSTLPAGTYFLVSEVTSTGGTSAPAASTGTVTVAPPFVLLAAPAIAPPKSVKPGKKASAVVTITNSGNVTATGPLEIVLSARPPGTSGSADISIQTVSEKIKIAPTKSGKVHVTFLVPPTLPAGTYSLVAQIDANNAFNESSIPDPIVSLVTFTVT